MIFDEEIRRDRLETDTLGVIAEDNALAQDIGQSGFACRVGENLFHTIRHHIILEHHWNPGKADLADHALGQIAGNNLIRGDQIKAEQLIARKTIFVSLNIGANDLTLNTDPVNIVLVDQDLLSPLDIILSGDRPIRGIILHRNPSIPGADDELIALAHERNATGNLTKDECARLTVDFLSTDEMDILPANQMREVLNPSFIRLGDKGWKSIRDLVFLAEERLNAADEGDSGHWLVANILLWRIRNVIAILIILHDSEGLCHVHADEFLFRLGDIDGIAQYGQRKADTLRIYGDFDAILRDAVDLHCLNAELL